MSVWRSIQMRHFSAPSRRLKCAIVIMRCPPSVRRRYLLTFSAAFLKPPNGIQWNLTGSKFSTSSTKFLFFRADQKNKMAAPTSDWLRHFRLLWNSWTEFNETWQEVWSQRPLPSLVFGPIRKQRWLPWPLIGWDNFYFSSETAEQNSTKL